MLCSERKKDSLSFRKLTNMYPSKSLLWVHEASQGYQVYSLVNKAMGTSRDMPRRRCQSRQENNKNTDMLHFTVSCCAVSQTSLFLAILHYTAVHHFLQ